MNSDKVALIQSEYYQINLNIIQLTLYLFKFTFVIFLSIHKFLFSNIFTHFYFCYEKLMLKQFTQIPMSMSCVLKNIFERA